MNWFQAKAYLKYIFKKKHWREGDFISSVARDIAHFIIYNNYPFYRFEDINDIRNDVLQSKQKVEVRDFGAGSKKFRSNHRALRHLVKYNASPQKQGELIFRFASYFKPNNIIELGTSLGLGTMYLALPNSQTKVYTIEGCPKVSNIANRLLGCAGANNVIQHVGPFREELPKVLASVDQVGMVYFDGHHAYQPTLDYFHLCLPKATEASVFIFDDIYWSREMAKAWNEISAHPSVSLSFDFFRFGVLVLNVPHVEEHCVIKSI
ncbi:MULTISPECIES: O-methyltransferase [unclassified Saccharicrinis]|uniref:O-methyltransferase n=1 Tax=unclassified Saccharicrinis TaxID=2646859 RepID=UPI003D32676E